MRSRTHVFAGLLLASVVSVSAGPMYAAPRAAVLMPGHLFFGKAKLVKFTIRNSSGDVLQLQYGDQQMSVEDGKAVNLQLPVGTQVVTKNATKTMTAGATIASVTTELDGATVDVH